LHVHLHLLSSRQTFLQAFDSSSHLRVDSGARN
jgi:hypothetical protein